MSVSGLSLEQHLQKIGQIKSLIDWKQPLTETDRIYYRDHLLSQWEEAKLALERAKAVEMDLRKQIVDVAFDPSKKAGTERVELHNGFELKSVKKQNYGFVKRSDGKLDKGAVDSALSAIEATSPAGAYIAENLVKWEPTLSLTEYKKLDEPLRKIIDAVIVVTDGAPTLEIVPPKGQK